MRLVQIWKCLRNVYTTIIYINIHFLVEGFIIVVSTLSLDHLSFVECAGLVYIYKWNKYLCNDLCTSVHPFIWVVIYLHHQGLWPLLEHRLPARALQASRSLARLSSCHHHHHHHHHHLLIIIVAFGSYWNIGHLQELSRHPNPGLASQVVPKCNPSSLHLFLHGKNFTSEMALELQPFKQIVSYLPWLLPIPSFLFNHCLGFWSWV